MAYISIGITAALITAVIVILFIGDAQNIDDVTDAGLTGAILALVLSPILYAVKLVFGTFVKLIKKMWRRR